MNPGQNWHSANNSIPHAFFCEHRCVFLDTPSTSSVEKVEHEWNISEEMVRHLETEFGIDNDGIAQLFEELDSLSDEAYPYRLKPNTKAGLDAILNELVSHYGLESHQKDALQAYVYGLWELETETEGPDDHKLDETTQFERSTQSGRIQAFLENARESAQFSNLNIDAEIRGIISIRGNTYSFTGTAHLIIKQRLERTAQDLQSAEANTAAIRGRLTARHQERIQGLQRQRDEAQRELNGAETNFERTREEYERRETEYERLNKLLEINQLRNALFTAKNELQKKKDEIHWSDGDEHRMAELEQAIKRYESDITTLCHHTLGSHVEPMTSPLNDEGLSLFIDQHNRAQSQLQLYYPTYIRTFVTLEGPDILSTVAPPTDVINDRSLYAIEGARPKFNELQENLTIAQAQNISESEELQDAINIENELKERIEFLRNIKAFETSPLETSAEGLSELISFSDIDPRIRSWEVTNERTLTERERGFLRRFIERGLWVSRNEDTRAILTPLFLSARQEKFDEIPLEQEIQRRLGQEHDELESGVDREKKVALDNEHGELQQHFSRLSNKTVEGNTITNIMSSVLTSEFPGTTLPYLNFTNTPSNLSGAQEVYRDIIQYQRCIQNILQKIQNAERKNLSDFNTLFGITSRNEFRAKHADEIRKAMFALSQMLDDARIVAEKYIGFYELYSVRDEFRAMTSRDHEGTVRFNISLTELDQKIEQYETKIATLKREAERFDSSDDDHWKANASLVDEKEQEIHVLEERVNIMKHLRGWLEQRESSAPHKALFQEMYENPLFDLHSQPQDRFNALTDTILHVADTIFPEDEHLAPSHPKIHEFLIYLCVKHGMNPEEMNTMLKNLNTKGQLQQFYTALGIDIGALPKPTPQEPSEDVAEDAASAPDPTAVPATPPPSPTGRYGYTKQFLQSVDTANIELVGIFNTLHTTDTLPPEEIIETFNEQTTHEKLKEAEENQQRGDSSFHDRYMAYRELIHHEDQRDWINSHPEFYAGNWFNEQGQLIPDVIENVLEVIIPDEGKLIVNGTEMLGRNLKDKIKANDQTALNWVKELEQYIRDFRDEGGFESNMRESYEEAQRALNDTQEGLGDIFQGITDKLLYGDIQDKAQVGILIGALWMITKKKPQLKTLFWTLGGLWAFDAIQADTTNLFGGESFIDNLFAKDFAEVRDTPLGAYLNEVDLKGPMEQKAGLLMLGIPMDQLLDWAEPIVLSRQDDLVANRGSAGKLYYEKMPRGLKVHVNKLFPDYRGKDDFRGAIVMWTVFEKFLQRSAKKAIYHEGSEKPSAYVGFNYLRAKYSQDPDNELPDAGYRQYRLDIGTTYTDVYSKNTPLFSMVLEHEMTRTNRMLSTSENRSVFEWARLRWSELYTKYRPILGDAKNWTQDQLHYLFEKLRNEVYPLTKETIENIASQGWTIATDSFRAGKNWLILQYHNHQIKIEKIKNTAIWAVTAPYKLGGYIVNTVEEQLPMVISTMKSLSMHALEIAKETLSIGRTDLEKEQVSPRDEFELYAVLEDLELIPVIKRAYRIDTMDNVNLPGAPNTGAYNIPILEICKEIMAHPGDFGQRIEEYMSNAEKTRYAEGRVEWKRAGGATANGTSVPIDFNRFQNIPKGIIGRAFVMDVIAVRAINDYLADPAKGIVDIVTGIVKELANFATLGFNEIEPIIWGVVEHVDPSTTPNLEAIKKTQIIRDILDKEWNDGDDNVIWNYNHYAELVEDMAESRMANADPVERQIFTKTAKELFSDVIFRASYNSISGPGEFLSGGFPEPKKSEVEAGLGIMMNQILNDGSNILLGDFPLQMGDRLEFKNNANTANANERFKLDRP